jgi:hypothetical protein
MLSPCPLPKGRDKEAFTPDELNTAKARFANVRAERDKFIKYSDELAAAKTADIPKIDAKFQKGVTDAQNSVVKAQNKVDAIEQRVMMLGSTDKAVQKEFDLVKAEVNAYEQSLKAQKRIEDSINDLYNRYYAANPEITPQMVKAYEGMFNLAKTTTDPKQLKAIDVQLRQMERAMEAEVKGSAKLLEEVFQNKKIQTRNFNTQVERSRVARNRVTRAEKKLDAAIAKTDTQLSKELEKARKSLDGATLNRDTFESVAQNYTQRINKQRADKYAAKSARDEYNVRLGESVALDPRKGRAVFDFVRSRLGWTLEMIGAEVSGKVRLSLQRAGYLAENAVNAIGYVVQVKTVIDFTNDFRKAANKLGISRKERLVLQTETLEVGQIPDFLNFFDSGNPVVKQVQNIRYSQYVEAMTKKGFTITQIDEFVNQAVKVSKVFDDIRVMGNAMGVGIETIDPFIGYITRIFSLDGDFALKRIVNPDKVTGDVMAVGKDSKFQFDIARKYEFLVPQDIDIAADIFKITVDELTDLINNPVQMQLFIEKNLAPAQIDTLLNVGFFQKLPMSSREVYDYLMAQYRLPFSSAADMFNLDIVENLGTYRRAIGDQANISMMLGRIFDEEGVKLGWSIDINAYEADKLLPADKRQFANYVNMEDKMLTWTARLGLPADVQAQFGKFYMHPVVADQVIALIDITKSPALLGQLGGFIGHANRFFSSMSRGVLVNNFPVYLSNQALGNFISSHAASTNPLNLPIAFIDHIRVMRGGLEVLDNTVKRWEVGGKQYTHREWFQLYYENNGTAVSSVFGERGRPSVTGTIDYAKDLLSNSSGFVYRLMTYMFGTGELTGGKALNSMERVLGGVDYFMKHADNVLNSLSSPVFYTANLIDSSAKWANWMSVGKRIDGASAVADKAGTYMFSQSVKQFDTVADINAHVRAYFPDMRDVGSTVYGVNKYAIMFTSWQASMIPRVLRDVARRPWRYAAYEKLRQFIAEPLTEDDSVTEAGISPEVVKGLPYYIGRVKDDDNKLIMWMDESYNPATSTFQFVKELTGVGKTAADKRAELQGEGRNDTLVRLMNSSYPVYKIIYELTSGTNLRTGKPLRRTDGRGIPILGFEAPPELYSIINNAVPAIGAIDRMDIPAISGLPTIRDNNGNIIQKGYGGLGGAIPDATGRVLRNREVANEWVGAALSLIGGKLKIVDMARQNKITYNDISRSLDIVGKQVDTKTQELLRDQRDGILRKGEYEKKLKDIERLIIAREQLQYDEDMVWMWLNERGVLTDKEIKQKERYMTELQQKGMHPSEAAIQRSADRLLRFRQSTIYNYVENKKKAP